jgi:O-glycosyl hydrolase
MIGSSAHRSLVAILVVTAASAPRVAAAQTVTVTINTTTTFQTIDGFGVAQPRLGPGMVGDDTYPGDAARLVFGHPNRTQLMNLTFSSLNGIGATILRTKITGALEPSPGAWNYSDPAQVWLMKEAVARGPVKLLATAWTPPAWMKTNNSVFYGHCSNSATTPCSRDWDPVKDDAAGDEGCDSGATCVPGALALNHWQDFADYMLHYARDFASANQLKLHAISFSNEPEAQVEWDGCAWYGDWIAAFLDQYLRPAFAANPSVTVKVMSPEAAGWDHLVTSSPEDPLYTGPNMGTPAHPLSPTTLLGPTIANLNALGRVDIIGGHLYGGFPTAAWPAGLVSSTRRVWMTEESAVDTWTMAGAVQQAAWISQSLTGSSQASAWVHFIYFGVNPTVPDDPMTPIIESKPPNGLVSTDGTSIEPGPSLWALGNFSKFVRPGFVRVGSSSNNGNILVSAFKDPAIGQLVVVVVNQGTTARTVQMSGLPAGTWATPYLTENNADIREPQADVLLTLPVSVPAQSITTYVARPPRVTSDLLWRKTDGSTMLWLSSIASTASYPGTLATTWQVKGVGDFDGNARGDIFWRHTNGANTLWKDGSAAGAMTVQSRDNNWSFQGIGDFNGDGKSDLLWRCLPQAPATACGSTPSGIVEIWFQGNPNSSYQPGGAGTTWSIEGVGHVDGNAQSDILWRETTGQVVIWHDGYLAFDITFPGTLDLNWKVQGIGEFDGNALGEIVWRCLPATVGAPCGSSGYGTVALWHDGGNGTTYHGIAPSTFSGRGVGDYDGDGKADIPWRSSPTTVVIWRTADQGAPLFPESPGTGWDVATTGRFDK